MKQITGRWYSVSSRHARNKAGGVWLREADMHLELIVNTAAHGLHTAAIDLNEV